MRIDVLQPDLATRDELGVGGTADLDLPDLLGATLLDRDRLDVQAARTVGAKEVGSVGDSDGLLPSVLHRLEGARGRKGFDHASSEGSAAE